MTCLAVTLGAIELDGSEDSDGITWAWSNIPGWWEGGTPSGEMFGRPGAHGSGRTASHKRGRFITLEGTATADPLDPDPVETLLVARRKLILASDLVDVDGTFTVDEGNVSGVLQATVRRSPGIAMRFPPNRSKRAMEFAVPLCCTDWRKVSTTLTQTVLGAGGSIDPAGDAPATPSLRISGDSAANVGVTNVTTGETISTNLNLTGGDVLVIDCATGLATLNGADATNNVQMGSRFFDIGPGANTVNLVNAGTASLRVDYRASWQ